MDLVGPLPKSARGHEHILVIVDYATRYPEAVPLRKATAKAIAQELFLLSSRVGIPVEILTDQGTPFMSRLMADLCRLLRVKQLRTTVYHPQTDGTGRTLQSDSKADAETGGRRGQVRLGSHDPLCPFRDPRSSPGLHWLHPLRAPLWSATPRPPGCGEGGLGTTAGSPSLGGLAREADEGKDRPGHAVSPGTLVQSAAGSTAPLQPGSPATGVPGRRQSHGPSPQCCLQIPGHLAGALHDPGEDWAGYVPCAPARTEKSRAALPHKPSEEVGWD